MTPARRIGLTMRETQAPTHAETRDAIARNWMNLLPNLLPESHWMPIPNIGKEATVYARDWGIDGLIITGGDNIGETPDRDLTERTLLEDFIGRSLPVLGVCRGLQVIHTHFGGSLLAVNTDTHLATRHLVHWTAPADGEAAESEVNSFHTLGIAVDDVRLPFRVMATSADGHVEAICSDSPRLLGLMWHPEREPAADAHDCNLFSWLFNHNGPS